MSAEMVEVVIDSIRVSLMSQQRIVILREADGERYLPIWIGVYEAEAIAIALQEVEVARPLTHDLLKNIFTTLNAEVIRIEIIALRDDTYYAQIVAMMDGQTLNIDARPSDSLALAVRTHVPVLVARTVMEHAGIMPEEDLQEQAGKPAPRGALSAASGKEPERSAEDAGGEERLSVFEDFLGKLDLGNIDEDEEDDDKPAK